MSQTAALIATHLPYWVIAIYMIVAARRMRRRIEAVIRELNRLGSHDR